MRVKNSALHFAASLPASLLLSHAASAQSNFYEGKTVSLIVGNAAGGGYDVAARALARHMRKYIPGVANIIVKNMQGAGGLAAANYMYSVAEPDGLTFAVLSRATPMQPTLGIAAAKYKAENYTWLGTSSSYADSAYFLVTMGDAPFQTVADLRESGVAAGADRRARRRRHRHRRGAGRQGRAQAQSQTDPRLQGLDRPLDRDGARRDRRPRDRLGAAAGRRLSATTSRRAGCASCCSSAARRAGTRCRTCRPRASLHQIRRTARCSSWSSCRSASPTPMSRRRTCPRIAPQILQTAFMKTFQDPDYLVEAKKLDLDVSPLDGATVRGMIARLAQSPPELIARYKAILEGK